MVVATAVRTAVTTTAVRTAVTATEACAQSAALSHDALPARSATNVRFAGLAVLCAATLVAPALLLVWMPIVLGVPHIASDVRYLVLPLPRKQVIVAVAACAALVVLKAASLATGVGLLRAEMVVVATWLLVALALARGESARRGRAGRRRSHVVVRHSQTRDDSERGHIERGHISREYAARGRTATWLLAVSAALLIVALPLPFAIIAAMAHNVVAVIAWLVVSRPGRRHALAVVVAIAAAVAVLGLVGPAVASHTGGDVTRWLTIDRAAGLMFGGMPLPTARALVIAFAFLQAVHYAIWLGWIPRDAQPPRGGAARNILRPPQRASRIALAVAATTLLVIGAALVDAAWARSTYLALATFHIYLELVVLAAMFAGPTALFAGRAHRSRA